MKWKFLEKRALYTGEQLRSHFALETIGIQGDSVVAFLGPARVEGKLVDLIDARQKAYIRSDEMLHFIFEYFDRDLPRAILRQCLFVSTVVEEVHAALGRVVLWRQGNDLYDGQKKLSVSIATVSPVSALIHVGINVTTQGTPVPTTSLSTYGITPKPFAKKLMRRWVIEGEGHCLAQAKVRGVS